MLAEDGVNIMSLKLWKKQRQQDTPSTFHVKPLCYLLDCMSNHLFFPGEFYVFDLDFKKSKSLILLYTAC
jgi:hypothetical protein